MTAVRLGRVAVALGLAALLAGALVAVFLVADSTAGTRRTPLVASSSGAEPIALPAAAGRIDGTPRQQVAPVAVRPPGPGARLRIPRLGVDAEVVPVRVRDSVMQVPRDPRVVGWWRAGAVPGATRGSAVLVGHVNYDGTAGAFGALPRARPGDAVALTDGGVRFRVTAVRVYPKTSGLPTAIFDRSGPPQLVLITCGGPFDPTTGNYEDNIAVYATRVGARTG